MTSNPSRPYSKNDTKTLFLEQVFGQIFDWTLQPWGGEGCGPVEDVVLGVEGEGLGVGVHRGGVLPRLEPSAALLLAAIPQPPPSF